jgi:hypothetical protein
MIKSVHHAFTLCGPFICSHGKRARAAHLKRVTARFSQLAVQCSEHTPRGRVHHLWPFPAEVLSIAEIILKGYKALQRLTFNLRPFNIDSLSGGCS